ncbi:MAG: hypothetical protein HYZ87_02950 [Candidatus Omnitrophica bacterium]|nr:hypothetical protein [Candidatus Omnitrophota bacterium]
MRKRQAEGQRGFSLVEAVMSLALGAAFLAAVYGSWFFCTKVWNQESLRSKLRADVEFSIEKIKEELRLSDGNGLVFYPQNASTYTAISLPRATPDASGFLSFSGGNVAWDKTMIYHIYQNGSQKELRKTVFDSFNPSIPSRQAQLDSVVANGSGAGLSESSFTRTLFSSEDVSLTITPQAATFDGYSTSTTRSANTSFGSKKLTAGNHQVRFEVTGKNTASSGYQMGLDELSLTPSGGLQEVEILSVAASSGQAKINQDMTPYGGVWGGNQQVNYQSSGLGQFITLDTYYDQWLESNFSNMTYTNTQTTGLDPHLEISSRENQGLSPAWQADSQTQAVLPGDLGVSDKSYRSVIFGGVVTKSAKMIRLRFDAASNQFLTIQSAYFGVRQGTEASGSGTSEFASIPIQLFFDNAPVPQGSPDPVGAVNPGSVTSGVIPAGHHVWTNWFEYALDTSVPLPDFLVSLYAPSGAGSVRTLNPIPSPPVPVHAYSVEGNQPISFDWSTLPDYQSHAYLFSVAELAGWDGAGSATSQIYDTQLVSTAYSQVTWSSVLPSGSSAFLKVRSSANANMSGATAWSALPAYLSSPASLSGLSNLRYAQFQVTLNAAPPYTSTPQVDNVKITWPGATGLVTIGGYFTRRPDYGIFKVKVDGEDIVKALEIKLNIAKTYQGKTYSFSLNSEGKTRNTGK